MDEHNGETSMDLRYFLVKSSKQQHTLEKNNVDIKEEIIHRVMIKSTQSLR